MQNVNDKSVNISKALLGYTSSHLWNGVYMKVNISDDFLTEKQ